MTALVAIVNVMQYAGWARAAAGVLAFPFFVSNYLVSGPMTGGV